MFLNTNDCVGLLNANPYFLHFFETNPVGCGQLVFATMQDDLAGLVGGVEPTLGTLCNGYGGSLLATNRYLPALQIGALCHKPRLMTGYG